MSEAKTTTGSRSRSRQRVRPKPDALPANASPEEKYQQGYRGYYYLVNPGGAVHSVSRDHARARLKIAGWRLATAGELAELARTKIQRYDRPIAPVWSPDPEDQLGDPLLAEVETAADDA